VDWTAPTLDGGIVRLSELRGRPVLVYVWADWCDQACFRPFEALEEAADANASWLDVITIDLDGSIDGAHDAVTRHHITLPVVVDDGTIRRTWDLHVVPAWYVLDADGVVRASRDGPLDRASIADLLETVLPADET
jgi:peroxiredoxin